MARPKVKIDNAEVWLLEEVIPYDGSTVVGIFLDPEVAKKDRKGKWTWVAEGSPPYWSTRGRHDSFESFLLLTPHTVRVK